MVGYKQELQLLIKKYGKLALGTHIVLCLASYTGCYFFAKYNNLSSEMVMKYFRKNEEEKGSEQVKNLSTYGIAYMIYKGLMPVRVPLTVAVIGLLVKLKK